MAVLGIDIGGSGIKGAPVDVTTGEFTAERLRLPTPEKAQPEDVASLVNEIVKHFKWKGAIGLGFPAVVLNGVTMTAANVSKKWINCNAATLFNEATGCPSYVVNDADAAGIAEMKFGAGKDYNRGIAIMITLGTGIGTAIFTDGVLVPNTELGHIILDGKDAEKRASDAARQNKNLTWEEWGNRLNQYFQYMEALFWPEVFIIGGGVSKDWEKFFPYLTLRAKTLPAKLLNQAGIVGAALYAYEKDQV
jgi:polyphosphate glucokinase